MSSAQQFIRSSGLVPFARWTFYLGLVGVAIIASGCDGSATTGNLQATPKGDSAPRIVTVQEGTYYKQPASNAVGVVTWIEASVAGSDWTDTRSAQDAARQAISDNASALQAVDYASLSLPAFVTTTRTLNLRPDQIDGHGLRIESYGSDSQGGKWAVYGWQGPEIPQLSERPLVHRWVHIFALVNLDTNQVNTLFPTIVGQVYE